MTRKYVAARCGSGDARDVLAERRSLGQKIAAGKTRLIEDIDDMDALGEGEVLVTDGDGPRLAHATDEACRRDRDESCCPNVSRPASTTSRELGNVPAISRLWSCYPRGSRADKRSR